MSENTIRYSCYPVSPKPAAKDRRDTMPTGGLQPIVMAAGRGNRLTDLCATDRPKCLMPVGPFPVIFYALRHLERHGFTDAICIVLESQRSEVQSALDKLPLKLQPQLATIPSDSDYGTADSLRHVRDRIVGDVLIMSADTVTNASLEPMLNDFRQHNATVSVLLLNNPHLVKGAPVAPTPVRKNVKIRADRDLIGIDDATNRLLFHASSSDFDEVVEFSGHLMRTHPRFTMYSQLLDTHIYAMKRWVIDQLLPDSGLTTIKGELIPHVIEAQLKSSSGPKSDAELGDNADDLEAPAAEDPMMDARIASMSLYNDSRSSAPYSNEQIRCYATTDKQSFAVRVNTPPDFWMANNKIFSIWQSLFINAKGGNGKASPHPELVSENATIKSTQMTDCAVGDNSFVAEKTSLKASVLGTNCSVKSRTRILDSYLMNGVIVEEGVVIENCVIADRVLIKKGCVLKNCMIGPNFTCEEGQVSDTVHLCNADGFLEI